MIRSKKQRSQCDDKHSLSGNLGGNMWSWSGGDSSYGLWSKSGDKHSELFFDCSVDSSMSGLGSSSCSQSGSKFYRKYKEWLSSKSKQLKKLLGY